MPLKLKESYKTLKCLIIDNDAEQAPFFHQLLEVGGFGVQAAATLAEAFARLQATKFDLILLETTLPDGNGILALDRLLQSSPNARVVMISSCVEISQVVDAVRNGAHDYLVKPISREALLTKVSEWSRWFSNRRQASFAGVAGGEEKLVARSPAMRSLVTLIQKYAKANSPVLLLGESGTGKSHIAKFLHEIGPRKNGPFVTVSTPNISPTLIESDLFGHERGAFTGAIRDKVGRIEVADKGTAFFDEIGDLAVELQAKLLRFLQTRQFERVGGSETRSVDVRIISATNRNLEDRIRTGHFREDLFYRLNVLVLQVPSLRERQEDLPVLAQRFVDYYSTKVAKRIEPLGGGILSALSSYEWPGNVREMQNVLERAVVICDGETIRLRHLTLGKQQVEQVPSAVAGAHDLESVEMRTILSAIQENEGNISKAAKMLGVARDTIYRKLKRYKGRIDQESGAA